MDGTYRFTPGATPLLISMPHVGTELPAEIAERMTPEALRLADTDWHVDALYDVADSVSAGVLAATHSRYVVDLNRDPAGEDLYPGADNTEIVPTTTFAREPIYQENAAPDDREISRRIALYWRPYHFRIRDVIADMRTRFGFAVLFDAHSIRSRVPRFFDGVLPDFNFGTASGVSADHGLAARAYAALDAAEGFTAVANGRFTGGYITRTYGAPDEDVHTLQLELSQRTYMDETHPYAYRPDLADRVKPVLDRFVREIAAWIDERR